MKSHYKIQNESIIALVIPLIAFLLFFASLIIINRLNLSDNAFFFFLIALVISSLAYLVEQLIGTHLYVYEDKIRIIYPCCWRTVYLKDIKNVTISDYSRRRKHHKQYRKSMIIVLNNGKTISLNDAASRFNSFSDFVFGQYFVASDYKVPLYNAYVEIVEKTGITISEDKKDVSFSVDDVDFDSFDTSDVSSWHK